VDRRPYVCWYRFREALELLDHAGFDVTWTASTTQIECDDAPCDPRSGDLAALDGMLYVVCRRT
jgi:hypothetical protein